MAIKKVCKKCRQEKLLRYFRKKKDTDEYWMLCRKCSDEKTQERTNQRSSMSVKEKEEYESKIATERLERFNQRHNTDRPAIKLTKKTLTDGN